MSSAQSLRLPPPPKVVTASLQVSDALRGPVAKVAQGLFGIYTAPVSDTGLQAQAVSSLYAPEGTFLDPIVNAKGVREVQLQMYTLPRIFTNIEVELEAAHVEPGSQEGTLKVAIDNKQIYTVNFLGSALGAVGLQKLLPGLAKPSVIPLEVSTLLTLRESDLKILHHHDIWKGSIANASPVFLRAINLALINSFLRLMGCERDIEAKLGVAAKA